MTTSHTRATPAATLFVALGAAALISIAAVFGGKLPADGQTAGPVATRTAPIVVGPGSTGAGPPPTAPISSPVGSGEPANAVSGAAIAPRQPASASIPPAVSTGAGQGTSAGAATQAINLPPADGVTLVAGRSLLYVPPGSASCAAAATLSYDTDRVEFAATCASGGAPGLSSPALLCMEPSAPMLASALGNLTNLSLTRTAPLPSHVSPSRALVCASISSVGGYSLSVTAKNPPEPALHSIRHRLTVSLPAVGLGGLLRP